MPSPDSGSAVGDERRAALAERCRRVRRFTETLCEPLETEDYVIQTMPSVSPAKWHLAHTSWFFETFVLASGRAGYESFDERYSYLFNSYYNSVGRFWSRSSRGVLSRPTVAELYRYRAHVDAALGELLDSGACPSELLDKVELGLHHEQQHQELLLTDLKHIFASNPLRPAYRPSVADPVVDTPPVGWLDFEGGLVDVGHDGSGFAYDNETPTHRAYLEPYRLATRPVANVEVMEFIDDGGYERADLWLSDGWATVRAEGWGHPCYWEQEDGVWHAMSLRGFRRLPEAETASHLSYYEADAIARWRGARLPTEAEWEVAAREIPIDGNFVDDGRLHPRAAEPSPERALDQIYGDVWEWTQSPYSSYPGYRPTSGALGEYNGKFMCNQLVLRGGSCASSRDHLRPTYRNFFEPDARWQFSGVRLAVDA